MRHYIPGWLRDAFHLDEGWRGVLLRTDWLMPVVILGLCGFGCAVIYSASANSTTPFWSQQLMFIGLGFVAYAFLAMLDYEKIRRYARFVYFAGVALLIPVAVCALLKMDLGTFVKQVNGARRWIDIGAVKIQPSEFAKVTTLVMLAAVLEGVRYWGWRAARDAWAARRTAPVWVAPAALVGTPPARALAALLFPLTLLAIPGFLMKSRAKWARDWWAWARGLLRVDVHALLGVLSEWPGVRVAAVAALPIGLIFVQPDLKSCIVYLPMLATLLYIARLSLRFFAAVGFSVMLLAGVIGADMVGYSNHLDSYKEQFGERSDFARQVNKVDPYEQKSPIPKFLFKDYQRERILSFFRPEVIDPTGAGTTWNVNQAIIAVGRGGLSGTGWNRGLQAMLGYLPELAAHNDFVFSVFAEEFGFVGGVALLAAYAFLIGNCLRTAARARDRFGALLCCGVAAVLTVHVVVNIGMNIGFMPVSGLPLPFLSYGGSFVLSCFLLLGLVQSVHRYSRELPPRSGSGSDISTNALSDVRRFPLA